MRNYPASMPYIFMLFFKLLVFLSSQVAFGAQASNHTTSAVPALIVFGDSIVDPGNNNVIETLTRCNFPPYGKDFVGHKATGRFSNGKIPSDLIASRLGIKEYLPAYLGTQLDAHELLTGVSFASGGSGYDPLTSQLVSALSLGDQLKLFKEYKQKLEKIAGTRRASRIISKSLFLIVMGTDDIVNTYFTSPFRSAEFDLPSYINFMTEHAMTFLKELHHLGARRIGVVGVPPVGCVPSQRTLAGGIERVCVSRYNKAARMFNSKLSMGVQSLNNTLPGSLIVYMDIYSPLLDLIQHPFKYGFEEVARGCCGTGLFEVVIACNSITSHVCEVVSKYVFWDSYHPTEKAYTILIRRIFERYGSLIPS